MSQSKFRRFMDVIDLVTPEPLPVSSVRIDVTYLRLSLLCSVVGLQGASLARCPPVPPLFTPPPLTSLATFRGSRRRCRHGLSEQEARHGCDETVSEGCDETVRLERGS